MVRKKYLKASFILLCMVGMVLPIAGTAYASSTDYPNKPIRLVVPFGAGGSTDLAARALAAVAPNYLGQPIVVMNRPGAGGATAMLEFLKADLDGYTMVMDVIGSRAATPAVTPGIGYDDSKFTPVALTQITPIVIGVRADSPFKSLKGFVEFAKKDAKQVRFSSTGPGSVGNLSIAQLSEATGIDYKSLTNVPFKSGREANLAMMRGNVDIQGGNISESVSFLKEKTMRGLVVTGDEKLADFKDIPTAQELGILDLTITGWCGVSGPPGLPRDIVEKWVAFIRKAMKDPAYKKMVGPLNVILTFKGPEDYAKFIEKEFKTYRGYAEKMGFLVK